MSSAPERSKPIPSSAPRRRILVVEDHADTASVTARFLAREGYDVRIASDATEAIELFTGEASFDLVIADIQLPDRDGNAMLREIRRHRDVPAIAVSGNVYPRDVEAALAAGFEDFVPKPFVVDNLLRSVRSALDAADQGAKKEPSHRGQEKGG